MRTSQTIELNPVKQLLAEHDAFRHCCDELCVLLDRLEHDGRLAAITSADYVVLLKTQATIRDHLNVHLVKEEQVFFPRLEEIIPQGRVKFLFLNYDHEFLRDYFESFAHAISDFENDRIAMHLSVERIINTGRLIVHNLLQHILAEDTVYFDIAEQGFDAETLKEIAIEMHEIEQQLRT